ncbi:hypothetical protein GCM10016234_08510 [Tianweitania populi]|uniref:Glycosyltransferase RgtA/B/C/D-like domain-containing protein n=2 Tax=Tianweitania populi TaxID=1607949 RepID=A0A8J3GKR6_9HYPH|nr:hypothetical protein GCM10016234_08510 [Tianweitania populi]
MAYGLAILIGLLFFAALFPLSFLLGQGAYFEQADAAQHVSGWLLFAADRWRLPLLLTQRVDSPTGVPIFLTDSIPLVALLLKPFYGLLPDGFHYFGIWHLIIRIGQAVGGVYLIRGLGCRSLFAALAAALFFLCWPANLFRLGHTALATHALLLVALAFYVRARLYGWRTSRTHLAFAVLDATALLTHPYLGIVVLAVHVAFAIDRAWLERKPLEGLGYLAATSGGLALLLWPLGYFANTIRSSGGFAHYSMNLLSPLCGSDFAPCTLMDATGGQYEGMNALGLGTFVLLPFALFVSRRRLLPMIGSAPGLMLVMLGLTAYALSNIIWFGPAIVGHYKVPHLLIPLIDIFRVSGRFFWLVGYGILAFGLAALLLEKRTWAKLLILAALIVQWADTTSFRNAIREQTSAPALYDFEDWKTAFPDLRHIDIYPAYRCDTSIPDAPYAFLQLLAARVGATINTSYVARPSSRCGAGDRGGTGRLPADNLFVALNGETTHRPALISKAIADGLCRNVAVRDQTLLMCSNDPRVNWAALGPAVQPVLP